MKTLVALALASAMALPAAAKSMPDPLLGALRGPAVVILGEAHDNPAHHVIQAAALRLIRPRAVVWEMLTPEQAERLPTDLSDPATVDRSIGWTGSGWPDFVLYHPLFMATPGAAHLAGGLSRDRVRRVFAEPLAQVFGPDAPRFGLDADPPMDERIAREAGLMAAHCDALPPELLPGMLAAQRLRDGLLARAALAALERTGGPVAVIAGAEHARTDWGVPALIRRAAPQVRVLSLGLLEAEPEDDGADPPPFDLWLVAAPPERDDPCAAFR